MSLRADWQQAKKSSELKFKLEHAAELKNVHTAGVTGYPVKFKEDLGPTLDKYEAAVKAKKAADAAKLATQAKAVIKNYRGAIGGVKTTLGKAPADFLEHALSDIEGKLH